MGVKRCPICKKELDIFRPEMWAYKSGKVGYVRYFCSWKCLRENEKRTEGVKYKVERTGKGGDRIELAKELLKAYAEEGIRPIRFMEMKGYKNPDQALYELKKTVRAKDPELYAMFPGRMVKPKKKEPETPEQYQVVKTANGMMHNINRNPPPPQQPPEQVPTVKVDGPLQIETAEPEQVEVVPVPTVQLVYDPSIAEEYKREQAEKQKITKPVNYDGFDVTAIRHYAYGELYRDEKHNCIDWRTPKGEEVSMTLGSWKTFAKDLQRALRVLGVDA